MWSPSGSLSSRRSIGAGLEGEPNDSSIIDDDTMMDDSEQERLLDEADGQRGLSGRRKSILSDQHEHGHDDDHPHSTRIGVHFETGGETDGTGMGAPTYRSETARSRARAYAGLGTADFFTSVVASFNSMSLGLLAIPYTFAKSGALLASLAMVCAAGGSALSLILLLECAKTINILPCNWYIVAKSAWPKPAAPFCVDLAIMVLTFGMCTSFLIAIGDLMPSIMHTLFNFHSGGFWVDRRTWIVLIGLLMCYPLSTMRTLSALKFTNSLTFLVLCALLSIIFLYATVPSLDPCQGKALGEVCKGTTEVWTPSLTALQLLPILIYTFCCQQNIFAIYNESNSQKVEVMSNVVYTGSILSLLLKLGIGLTVYLTYGSILTGNFFLHYPNSQLVGVARMCIVLKSAFSYPMQMHPCRNALASLVNQVITDEEWSAEDEAYVPSNRQLQVYTFGMCLGTFIVALTVSELGWFLALMGSTIAPIISYILPGLFYWQLHPHQTMSTNGHKKIAFGLMAIGCFIVPTCMALIIMKKPEIASD